MHFVVLKLASVLVSAKLSSPVSVELILIPFALVIIAIRPLHLPKSLFFVVVKLAVIHCPIFKGLLSMAMCQVIPKVSDVLFSIVVSYFTVTILHAVFPVSLGYKASSSVV